MTIRITDKSPKTYVVLGMHQGGTSIVSKAFKDQGKDLGDRGEIDRQIEKYKGEGYKDKELGETKIVIRKNNPKTIAFNKEWLYQLMTNSVRDQLSFNYSAWKTDMQVYYMPTWKETNVIKYTKHDGTEAS